MNALYTRHIQGLRTENILFYCLRISCIYLSKSSFYTLPSYPSHSLSTTFPFQVLVLFPFLIFWSPYCYQQVQDERPSPRTWATYQGLHRAKVSRSRAGTLWAHSQCILGFLLAWSCTGLAFAVMATTSSCAALLPWLEGTVSQESCYCFQSVSSSMMRLGVKGGDTDGPVYRWVPPSTLSNWETACQSTPTTKRRFPNKGWELHKSMDIRIST